MSSNIFLPDFFLFLVAGCFEAPLAERFADEALDFAFLDFAQLVLSHFLHFFWLLLPAIWPQSPQHLNERPCLEFVFFFMGNAVPHPSQIFLLLAGAISPQWAQHLNEYPCMDLRFTDEAFAMGFECIWRLVVFIW